MPRGVYERKIKCDTCRTEGRRPHDTSKPTAELCPEAAQRKRKRSTQFNRSPGGYRSRRKSWLRGLYGMTLEEYDIMLVVQDGACAICRKVSAKHLQVDHDHETGQVRALLCFKCNVRLAHVEDRDFLQAALTYLERFSG